MTDLPITNIEEWKSEIGAHSQWYSYRKKHMIEEFYLFEPYLESHLRSEPYTKHATAKGPRMIEGIVIKWGGDPFDLKNDDTNEEITIL